VRLSIVGSGTEKPALEARADALGATSSVEFLGHRDDVPRLLAESDVFVLPSRSEASPNALIEAMAAGLPVVACAVGGNLEIVDHGRTGLLVPPHDSPALASAIASLLEDGPGANAMGAAAREAVLALYGFDRTVASFERLYVAGSEPDESRAYAVEGGRIRPTA
jgi:glycosyltransferase involved in cell wall biosynthesis